MNDLLQDIQDWAKTYQEELPKDAKWQGKSQKGIYNSHYGIKHTEETKHRIGEKSKNRNWASPELTAHYGADNGRAKKVEVTINDDVRIYDCLKDFYSEYKEIPYSSLKWMAQKEKSSRGVGVRYV
jgi:hypothetical protein